MAGFLTRVRQEIEMKDKVGETQCGNIREMIFSSAKKVFLHLFSKFERSLIRGLLGHFLNSEVGKFYFIDFILNENLSFVDELKVKSESDLITIVIIGLHEGETALKFLDLIPNSIVIGFEPNPESFRRATEVLAKYGNRVEIYNKAIGARRGRAQLNRFKDSGMDSILDSCVSMKEDSVEVELSTLDSELLKINKVDLLQIDVQGYELQVFLGAQEMFKHKKIDKILTEALFERFYERQPNFFDIGLALYDHFDFCGFTSMKYGGQSSTQLLWVDAYFKSKKK